ncbi:MAG: type IV pilus twitching motility protein PilT [Armatimonadetes bacterium]|nr:type IV pilus twitching motility protein PilT [Armatimonadota bacterium]
MQQRPIGKVRPIEEVHIDDLLRLVVERGASDLHLAVGVPPILRIDGQLMPTNYEKLTPTDSQRLVYDILTDEQIQRFEADLQLDFSYSLAKVSRFRVNIFRDKGTVAAAFRVIPTRIPTIRELGLPVILEELSRKPRGLILVTGPTGSGKSTTLAAMVNQINSERSAHIITIEDPIEYLHQHKMSIINQRELGLDVKSFSGALRAALREDPDVILVGEMRDLDTISTAITCAETGHLVLATLHTINAPQTVDRVVDVFPPEQQEQIRFMLSNNLEAVLCQQLLPRAGMPGRVCAMEVMIASPAIRNLIRENKAHQITSVIQTSANLGMQTMDQSLRDLYQRGQITYDEALSRAMNPDEFKTMVATAGRGAPMPGNANGR